MIPSTPRCRQIDPLSLAAMSKLHVGQESALAAVLPYVDMFNAELNMPRRPAGVIALMGPTGTGKTYMVEMLAQTIHGCRDSLLRIDCGEFQLDHEVAKLIGAPPGYLGHRETQPMISQHELNAVTSERSRMSIVLIDEIEKAAPSLTRILLGVLDRGIMKLGDNTAVNFENCIIFLTSNLGARDIQRISQQGGSHGDMDAAAKSAFSSHFSPEFVNRIDEMITFNPLSKADVERILDLEMERIRQHISQKLGPSSFNVILSANATAELIRLGVSVEFGARNLKRALLRKVLQPIAALILRNPGPRKAIEVGFLNGEFTYSDCGVWE